MKMSVEKNHEKAWRRRVHETITVMARASIGHKMLHLSNATARHSNRLYSSIAYHRIHYAALTSLIMHQLNHLPCEYLAKILRHMMPRAGPYYTHALINFTENHNWKQSFSLWHTPQNPFPACFIMQFLYTKYMWSSILSHKLLSKTH